MFNCRNLNNLIKLLFCLIISTFIFYSLDSAYAATPSCFNTASPTCPTGYQTKCSTGTPTCFYDPSEGRVAGCITDYAFDTQLLSCIPLTTSPLTITTSQLPIGTVNIPYSAQLQATGGMPPYSWNKVLVVGGLLINTNGLISGTPTQSIGTTIPVRVTDANNQTTTKYVSLTVQQPIPPLTITSSQLPNATANTPYSTQLQATGGTPPYTWFNASGIPTGLNFTSNGVLSGTLPAGTYGFYAKVVDSTQQTTTKYISLTVQQASTPLTITTSQLPNATTSMQYSVQLQATGGTPPYRWTEIVAAEGLTLNRNGLISGTPTRANRFAVSATVTDATNQSTQKYLYLTVDNFVCLTPQQRQLSCRQGFLVSETLSNPSCDLVTVSTANCSDMFYCCPTNCAVIPVQLTSFNGSFDSIQRLNEINGKLTVATQRKACLTQQINDAMANPNLNVDLNQLQRFLTTVNLFIDDLNAAKTFWTSLSTYDGCLQMTFAFSSAYKNIADLESDLTNLHLNGSVTSMSYSGVTNNDPNIVSGLLDKNRTFLTSLINDQYKCLASEYNTQQDGGCIGSGYLIAIPLTGDTGNLSPTQRIAEIDAKIVVAYRARNSLKLTEFFLLNNQTCLIAMGGNVDYVRREITKFDTYIPLLIATKNFWTSIANYNSCLNNVPSFVSKQKQVRNLEELLGRSYLDTGVVLPLSSNCSETLGIISCPASIPRDSNYVLQILTQRRQELQAIINNPNSCQTTPTCNPGQVSTPFTCTCAMGATLNSQNICSCPGTQIYTVNGCIGCVNQCGNSCCQTGELCVTFDPCKGKPNCSTPVFNYCARPTVTNTAYCSNDTVRCNAGSPSCSGSNTPICGTTLGFYGDLGGPACTNPTRTTLNVNSVLCGTGLRETEETQTSCTKKHLCPKGGRYTSCREDRDLCQCVCPFKTKGLTPYCAKHNQPACPKGLTPTCSNSLNSVSCTNGKLVCVDNTDGSISLDNVVECK